MHTWFAKIYHSILFLFSVVASINLPWPFPVHLWQNYTLFPFHFLCLSGLSREATVTRNESIFLSNGQTKTESSVSFFSGLKLNFEFETHLSGLHQAELVNTKHWLLKPYRTKTSLFEIYQYLSPETPKKVFIMSLITLLIMLIPHITLTHCQTSIPMDSMDYWVRPISPRCVVNIIYLQGTTNTFFFESSHGIPVVLIPLENTARDLYFANHKFSKIPVNQLKSECFFGIIHFKRPLKSPNKKPGGICYS